MTKEKKLALTSIILAALYALEFFGTGIAIFKNLYYTFAALPFLLSVVALIPLATSVANAVRLRRPYVSVALVCVTVLMAVGHFLFTAFVLSKLTLVLIYGLPFYIAAALVGVFLFLILIYPRLRPRDRKITVVALSVVIFFVCVFGVFKLNFFYYTSDGVVFAVEDEYQIAWSTSVQSVGYVTVGEHTFYDMSGGENNVCKLHKVTVPMSVLDEERSYALHSTAVYSNTAYLALHGGEHTKRYTFRPVDTTDGLQIYNISDNHECIAGAAVAAKYFGDALDVLLLNGDIVNDVSSAWQISMIYSLASKVTGGTRPVVYVRGNHECNGKLAADFHKYVGSYEGRFYYTVRFGELYLLVLDTNNDMSDENLLIRPAANFGVLRTEQTQWLNDLEDFGQDCEYRLLAAHMAFALSDYTRFPEWTEELVAATNGKFDLCLSGHSHVLDYAEAGTGTTTDYPVLRGSIRSNTRSSGEGVSPYAFTGCAVECTEGTITAYFTNSKGQVLREIQVK